MDDRDQEEDEEEGERGEARGVRVKERESQLKLCHNFTKMPLVFPLFLILGLPNT